MSDLPTDHDELDFLLDKNRKWAADMVEKDPAFFSRLCDVQRPDFLWIGCSDSRVPANEIVGVQPGEMFVHRNIANVVPNGDQNCLSVINFAVDFLGVKHIIVTGHYGCGGIVASMENREHGQLDNWLSHVKDVYKKHFDELERIDDKGERADRLCELNVKEQVINVAKTNVVQRAWREGRDLHVHGWIYRLSSGIITDLKVSMHTIDQLHAVYRTTEA